MPRSLARSAPAGMKHAAQVSYPYPYPYPYLGPRRPPAASARPRRRGERGGETRRAPNPSPSPSPSPNPKPTQVSLDASEERLYDDVTRAHEARASRAHPRPHPSP